MKQKVKRTNEEWLRIFQRRVASGLPVRKWCDANGISYEAYKYWEQKLRQNPGAASSAAVPAFVELCAEASPALSPAAPVTSLPPSAPAWPFRISFREFQISVASGADHTQLADLVRILQTVC